MKRTQQNYSKSIYDYNMLCMCTAGREMYVFDGNRLEHGSPRPLSQLGLPPEVDHIDAAMVWGYNSKTYFYSGNIYWRFDEEERHVELDYPREITTMWKGMGSHFDAAFQWKDGKCLWHFALLSIESAQFVQ